MARKREEKTNKDEKKTQKTKSTNLPSQNQNFHSLRHQLSVMKLTLREIPGDGNCLFGALADQLDGTPKTHMKHRQEVVTFMRNHRDDFEPFVEDDEPFEKHLSNLQELGTYGGNECIVAFARLNRVKVVIHQLNTSLWQIDGSDGKENTREIHISYHNGDHYNSIRKIGDCTASPPNIRLSVKQSSEPGEVDKKCYGVSASDSKGSLSAYFYEDECESYSKESAKADSSDWTENCHYIMERTGCQDHKLVQQYLVANCYDINDTVDDLLNYIIHQHKGEDPMTVSSSWNDHEAEVHRAFRAETPSNFPNSFDGQQKMVVELQEKLKNGSISSAKRKEIKKQIRKYQSNERKRSPSQKDGVGGGVPRWVDGEEQHMDTIVVKDIGCLSI